MAQRGYKLQEFVAHSANVNALSIGKKARRLFITGGDDHKVNLWAIGKPTSLMSLSGHTSPVDSVAFDAAEVLVLAGASTGAVKLWDLEEAKVVRTLTGHRSNCSAVEFHPFGEFFASGSTDTNLKIWDIRKKGCIHTYKGHTRGISTIKFTPDGRWVVSGGLDNIVKVWDLTAGKLLHDFNFHEGPIRSIDFHPLEFLLATGSADRTVKFWDLETFELIGSSRPEATGVRAITFHPDGRTLFSGSDDILKVYSWEPVICHDTVDMGWSTLGDLCINEGKLLGCSFYQNSVGVWIADVSRIEPYGPSFLPEQNDSTEKESNSQGSHPEKVGNGMRTSVSRCASPDCDTKDIKTIYVDSTGGNPVVPHKVGSLNTPKVVLPLDPNKISDLRTEKPTPAIEVQAKPDEPLNKSFLTPTILPRESPAGKDDSISGRESITFSRTKPGMLLRPAHVRKPSSTKPDSQKMSTAVESGSFGDIKRELSCVKELDSQTWSLSSDGARNSVGEKDSDIKTVTEKLEKVISPEKPAVEENISGNEHHSCNKTSTSVKFVNGVAVVAGRTRSLVERFERRESLSGSEDKQTNITTSNISSQMGLRAKEDQATNDTPEIKSNSTTDQATNVTSHMAFNGLDQATNGTPNLRLNSNADQATNATLQTGVTSSADGETNVTSHMRSNSSADQAIDVMPHVSSGNDVGQVTNVSSLVRCNSNIERASNASPNSKSNSTTNQAIDVTPHIRSNGNVDQASNVSPLMRSNSSTERAASVSPLMRSSGNMDRPANISPLMRSSGNAERTANVSPLMRSNGNAERAANVSTLMRSTGNAERATNVTPNVRSSNNSGQGTRVTRHARSNSNVDRATITRHVRSTSSMDRATNVALQKKFNRKANIEIHVAPHRRSNSNVDQAITVTPRGRFNGRAVQANDITPHLKYDSNPDQATYINSHARLKINEDQATTMTPHLIPEVPEISTALKEEPQTIERDATSTNDEEVIENLMQTHETFTSTLRSRLTKLTVVLHFWQRNDIKGAINATKKLPDHSVQADMISVLMEKTEILTLDLFSCILPVLVGLLDSKMERHANISLEMLLKLVAAFGPVIHSTISAPPTVGVDLHAEERRECCNQCSKELEKVQQILPILVRRGGLLAKCARELNLVLQES